MNFTRVSTRLARLEAHQVGDNARQYGEGISNLLRHIPLEESEREERWEEIGALKEKPTGGMARLLFEVCHFGPDGCPVGENAHPEEADYAPGA